MILARLDWGGGLAVSRMRRRALLETARREAVCPLLEIRGDVLDVNAVVGVGGGGMKRTRWMAWGRREETVWDVIRDSERGGPWWSRVG